MRLALIAKEYSRVESWLANIGLTLATEPAYSSEAAYLLLARLLIVQGQASSVLLHLPPWQQAAENR